MITRVRDAAVVPLEVWDLVPRDPAAPGATLFELRDAPHFPALLARAVAQLRAGTARTRASGAPDARTRGAGFVFAGGGGVRRHGIAEALASSGVPFVLCPEGPFAGERGGFELVGRGVRAVVADLGQTALKVSTAPGGARVTIARDLALLPPAERVPKGDHAAQRAALTAMLAQGLARGAAAAAGALDAVITALPCALDAGGTPGACSYAGLAGDRDLVPRALHAAGLRGVPRVLVLNDAELVAHTARATPDVPRDTTALVLTLGWGVGAALLLPDAPARGAS